MHFESNTFQQFNPTAPHSEKCEDLNTGSVISIYKNATSFCICGGCAKGVGSLSLCLGFSSETQESISQRHTRCFFVMQGLTRLLVQHRPLMVQIFFKSSGSDVQLLTFVSSLSLSRYSAWWKSFRQWKDYTQDQSCALCKSNCPLYSDQ